jgi:glycosyltransferase involved in cell wall biosynthesis
MSQNITAGIVLRNEAATIEKSIESISPFVNEIIVVEDLSVDGSREIVRQLMLKNSKIRLLSSGPKSRLADARNLIDDVAEGNWIIWWDADFIAYQDDDGLNLSFANIVQFINENPQLNQVLYGGANIGPVKGMTVKGKPYQGGSGDTQITKKGFMRFKAADFIDTRFYTSEPKTAYLNDPKKQGHFVHLDKIKPILRLILRDLLYTFEIEDLSIESTPDSFSRWMRQSRPNFSVEGAKKYTLQVLGDELTAQDNFAFINHPGILDGFEPFNWYKFNGTHLNYFAPESVDEPFLIYFRDN